MKVTHFIIATALLAGSALAGLSQSASATTLTAGQGDTAPGVAPDVFTSLGTSLVSTGSGPLGDGATYTDYVYKGNSFGANDLTFVLVVNAGDSHPDITEVTYQNFSTFSVDAGYCGKVGSTNCSAGYGQLGAPSGVGLSSDGSTVDFYFASGLNSSGNTDFLVIQTNATSDIKTATICLDGSADSCSSGFDPLDPTPLPGALPLFASGLGAMGLLLRRKKRKTPLAA